MIRISPFAVAMTTASVIAAALIAPTGAHAADPAVKLSAAGMAAELKVVSTTSATAARKGWKATTRFHAADLSDSGEYVVDPAGGIALSRDTFDGETTTTYAVAGKGRYASINDLTTRAAVQMMGRAGARYVFTPEAVNLDSYVKQNLPLPSMLLTEDVRHAGIRTSHGNGSRDYAFKGEGEVPVTLHVGPAGTLTSARLGNREVNLTVAYAYGPQHVTLPAASVTVDAKTVATAVEYLSMPAAVKSAANQGAAHTRSAAKGRPVQVASLREIVRRDAAACNSAAGVAMLKVGDIAGGVRVSATNPWTHRTVAYTVKASGTKVVVAKA